MTDRPDGPSIEQFEEWKKRYESKDQSASELFKEVSNVALCVSFDMIDKLRWWEKETLKLSETEIEQRLAHMSKFLAQLKETYLAFAEVDF